LARIVLARITAWANGFDPSATATEWGTGSEVLARRLSKLLDRLAEGPEIDPEIDRIVSGASGSRRGDALEAHTLLTAFRRRGLALPPVLAPKGVTGEYAGGFLAAAILAADGAAFGPTAGFAEVDPDLAVIPYDGRPLARPRRLLATTLAAGGAACWVVLDATNAP
jgi:3-oxoacyl-(acyl-carrier-protein) synthase